MFLNRKWKLARELKEWNTEILHSKETVILSANDSRKPWKFIKSKLKYNGSIPPIRCGYDIILDNFNDAEKFKDYFSSVCEKDDGNKHLNLSVGTHKCLSRLFLFHESFITGIVPTI